MTDDNEQPVEPAGAPSIAVKRNMLIASIAAAAVAAVAGTAAYLVKQSEVTHLRAAIAQLKTDKAAALKQYEDMRLSYSQTIAMQRCEVIDGHDDCIAAGLKRPPRFAEADRQLAEARRAEEVRRIAEENARRAKPETAKPETQAEGKAENAPKDKAENPRDAGQSAPAPARKLSLGEFVGEISKIPGVGIDPIQKERPAADRKDRTPR